MNKSGFFDWKDDREISIAILNSEVIDTTGRIKMTDLIIMEKLKCKCVKCGQEFSVNLPDDEILRKFSVTCKDCVADVNKLNKLLEKNND